MYNLTESQLRCSTGNLTDHQICITHANALVLRPQNADDIQLQPPAMSDPSQRVLNYLRAVGGGARVARVMEATGLDRETILRGAGRAGQKAGTRPAVERVRDDDSWPVIDWIESA